MLDGIVEHIVITFESIWENYPVLRPAIHCASHLWRHSVKFLRVLANNRNLATYQGRQPYIVCYLNRNPISEFLKHGYEMNELALKDNNEVSSIRKVINKVYQIHVRLYTPTENPELASKYAFELRSHFEFAWDIHPIRHWRAEIFRPAFEETLSILKQSNIEYVEADRANEQLELEKHLAWLREKLNYAKSLRGRRTRKTKGNRK